LRNAMLGPLASNYMRNKGFIITRPSWIEKRFTKSFWKNWFSVDPELFASVYSANRNTLASVPKLDLGRNIGNFGLALWRTRGMERQP
jgi:hypothetical protein